MLAFKVGSTPDSMVGYKSPLFMDFGWASAKLDDVMNFIPARLSLIILFFGAWISSLHPLDGLRVALRDRLKHDSPNAAHAESFFAGSLGVRLCGYNRVRGSRSSRLPTKPCVRVRTRLLMQLLSIDEVETNAIVFPLTLSTALLHQ